MPQKCYPWGVGQASNRRRSERVSIDVPLELRYEHEPARPGRALDLSREGLFAATDELRPTGTVVRLWLDIGASEPPWALGFVVRQEPLSDEGTPMGRARGVGILLTMTNEQWDQYWDALSVKRGPGKA